MHKFLNSVKFMAGLLIFILSPTISNAQTCCAGDTVYFSNEVDCNFCISIKCDSSGTWKNLPFNLHNNTPYIAQSCPTWCENYDIKCGANGNPQNGFILIPDCNSCANMKITVEKVNSIIVTDPNNNFIANSNASKTFSTSPQTCCTNGIDMDFNCTTKTIYFKCH